MIDILLAALLAPSGSVAAQTVRAGPRAPIELIGSAFWSTGSLWSAPSPVPVFRRMPAVPAPVVRISPPRADAPAQAGPEAAPAAQEGLEELARASSEAPEAGLQERTGALFDGRRELGRDFLSMLDSVRAGTAGPLPDAAKKARVLLVGGIFSNHTTDSLGAPLRRLQKLGLDASKVRIDTEGNSRAGLKAIEEAVRRSPGPVVLIGHSRGGVLVHDWFRLAEPALKAKVVRLVPVDAPLGGTEYADFMRGSPWRRFHLHWGGRLVFGTSLLRAVLELTTRVRRLALKRLPSWQAGDLDKVYAVQSVISPEQPHHRAYAGRQRLLSRLGAPENDGVVPVRSARVPGARNVLLRDVNHENMTLERPGWFKRLMGHRPHPDHGAGDLAETLLRLLFAGDSLGPN